MILLQKGRQKSRKNRDKMTNCGEIYLTLPSASEPPCAECEFRKLIEEKRGANDKRKVKRQTQS